MPVRRRRRSLALGLAAAGLVGPALAAEEPTLEQRIEQCASCHGDEGNSGREEIPSLAGQPEFFLLDQLAYFREGVRKNEPMRPFVEDLSDAEIRALAEHYAALAPERRGEPPDPELIERGAELAERRRCHSCHGRDLGGKEQIPRLADQRIDYLIKALKDYRDDERRNADTNMSASVAGLSDKDLRALAHYATSR